MPALTTSFTGGVLTITGDAANDTVALTGSAYIQLNGSNIPGNPHLWNTTEIVVNGLGGNDVLQQEWSIVYETIQRVL